jgi:hypothetical protein
MSLALVAALACTTGCGGDASEEGAARSVARSPQAVPSAGGAAATLLDDDESESSSPRFDRFVQRFRACESPLTIDNAFLDTEIERLHEDTLTADEVKRYISPTVLGAGTSTKRFFPLCKFPATGTGVVLLVGAFGGASGRDEHYIANSYSKNGSLKSSVVVGAYVADCSFEDLVTSRIELPNASIDSVHEVTNCDNGKTIKRDSAVRRTVRIDGR